LNNIIKMISGKIGIFRLNVDFVKCLTLNAYKEIIIYMQTTCKINWRI